MSTDARSLARSLTQLTLYYLLTSFLPFSVHARSLVIFIFCFAKRLFLFSEPATNELLRAVVCLSLPTYTELQTDFAEIFRAEASRPPTKNFCRKVGKAQR